LYRATRTAARFSSISMKPPGDEARMNHRRSFGF
jgi:hypothetical protein